MIHQKFEVWKTTTRTISRWYRFIKLLTVCNKRTKAQTRSLFVKGTPDNSIKRRQLCSKNKKYLMTNSAMFDAHSDHVFLP